jgi:FkbM family methyltransferase
MTLISSALAALRTRGVGSVAQAAAYVALSALNRAVGRRFIEKRIYDYRMVLDLRDRGISRTLLLFGQREMEHKVMLERVLKPGMTVLDIGANIGYYALMELREIGPSGLLIAVEPSPSNVELLKRNLSLNGHSGVEVHNAAISDASGTRSFFLSEMSNLNTFHDTGTGSLHLSGETIEVQTATVPEIMAGRRVDLIRMDVEGHEVEVINGLLPSVERGEIAPMVIFETHLSRYSPDHDIEAPLRRLFAQGYKVKLAGSSSERGSHLIEARGYKRGVPIRTDDVERVVFENIASEDAIALICREGGIRTVLVGRE